MGLIHFQVRTIYTRAHSISVNIYLYLKRELNAITHLFLFESIGIVDYSVNLFFLIKVKLH